MENDRGSGRLRRSLGKRNVSTQNVVDWINCAWHFENSLRETENVSSISAKYSCEERYVTTGEAIVAGTHLLCHCDRRIITYHVNVKKLYHIKCKYTDRNELPRAQLQRLPEHTRRNQRCYRNDPINSHHCHAISILISLTTSDIQTAIDIEKRANIFIALKAPYSVGDPRL